MKNITVKVVINEIQKDAMSKDWNLKFLTKFPKKIFLRIRDKKNNIMYGIVRSPLIDIINRRRKNLKNKPEIKPEDFEFVPVK